MKRFPVLFLVCIILALSGCPNPASNNPNTDPATCTVTFDSRGGSTPSPVSKTATVGAGYGTLAATVRHPYSFLGWYTEPDGQGRRVTAGTEVTDTADHTLYAFWGLTRWAVTVSGTGINATYFWSAAVAADGSIYAAGSQKGSVEYVYGTDAHGVIVSAQALNNDTHAVIVKYDPEGRPVWAHVQDGNNSGFFTVAADGAGNVYAAGMTKEQFAIIVKYNASGTVLWTRTASGEYSFDSSSFESIAVDAAGNVYAAGTQNDKDLYIWGQDEDGNNVSTTGSADFNNPVLVKYDPDGNAVWARTTTSGSVSSGFNAVALDASGNIYVAGYLEDESLYGYGTDESGADVSAAGSSESWNPVLVKYDSAGRPVWARTGISGSTDYETEFTYVDTDAAGNIYVTGQLHGNAAYSFGPGVSVTGNSSFTTPLLLKYDTAGTAQWVASSPSTTATVLFQSLSVDGGGTVYVAGSQFTTESFTYGTDVAVTGLSDENAIIVKYDTAGAAQWARTVVAGSGNTRFNSVALGGSGNLYVTGNQYDNGTYSYGPGAEVTAGGDERENALLVSYYP